MTQGSARELAAQARVAVSESPAFGVYLAALALLGFRWLSPIGSLYAHADWTDVLVALAAVLWFFERVRDGALTRALAPWQLPLLVYLALGCASAAVAVPGRGGSWGAVVLMAELAVLAAITADFASVAVRRRLIARVIVASSLATVALGAAGLILFYARIPNGLVGAYGEQFVGLPALAALIVMLVLLWRSRRRPTDLALWSALAGTALDGLAQDIDHFRHVWVLLGLVAGPDSHARAAKRS